MPLSAELSQSDTLQQIDLAEWLIGLWVGNDSDGDFASLRFTPMK